jgi:GNAT superfamily N-acetyltransferase
VFVEEGARGVGLGEAILEDLVAWFADRGCVGVDAPALPGHRQAKNFFEAHGFVARLLVMHHPTAPTPPTPPAGEG